jgi:hypothetical protein
MEQKNLHLIEADLQEAWLNVEQRRVRIEMLAWAAEVDRRVDPVTRNFQVSTLPSSSSFVLPQSEPVQPSGPPAAHYRPGPVKSRLARDQTQRTGGPLQQLGPERSYCGFF